MALTSQRHENGCCRKVHSRNSIDQLGAGQDHAGASENVLNEIQTDKGNMPYLTVPHAYDFERSVRVGYTDLGQNAHHGHQGDLEAEG